MIDGKGYTLQGTKVYASIGISISGRSNLTIRNLRIEQFYFGISLESSFQIDIHDNTIATNEWSGIILDSASKNNASRNTLTTNNGNGIYLHSSSNNNNIFGNNVTDNVSGVHLEDSESNEIFDNSINGSDYGIELHRSKHNSIYNNRLSGNNYGISLSNEFYALDGNSIAKNTIARSEDGIFLYCSFNNVIYENNIIASSEYGMNIIWSSSNLIYHNNLDNTQQASTTTYEGYNTWDDGYLSGGNYWSDHACLDNKNGPGQDKLGSDGIGDTPYIIDENNRDRYPIFRAGGEKDEKGFLSGVMILSAIIVTLTAILVLGVFLTKRRRRSQGIIRSFENFKLCFLVYLFQFLWREVSVMPC